MQTVGIDERWKVDESHIDIITTLSIGLPYYVCINSLLFDERLLRQVFFVTRSRRRIAYLTMGGHGQD